MSNNSSKRVFLNLDYVQGEDIELMFSITQDGVELALDEYEFIGMVFEKFNDDAVACFSFAESDTTSDWVATISSDITCTMLPQTYTYGIKMTSDSTGKTDTILYGDLTLRKSRAW
jgi:hypothetical protein